MLFFSGALLICKKAPFGNKTCQCSQIFYYESVAIGGTCEPGPVVVPCLTCWTEEAISEREKQENELGGYGLVLVLVKHEFHLMSNKWLDIITCIMHLVKMTDQWCCLRRQSICRNYINTTDRQNNCNREEQTHLSRHLLDAKWSPQ